eukprot:SAG31_NODE_11341_length_1040_cov_1.770457_1_plen_56_part_10
MRQMRDSGVEPGNVGFNILMCAAVETGAAARALQVFDEAFYKDVSRMENGDKPTIS